MGGLLRICTMGCNSNTPDRKVVKTLCERKLSAERETLLVLQAIE